MFWQDYWISKITLLFFFLNLLSRGNVSGCFPPGNYVLFLSGRWYRPRLLSRCGHKKGRRQMKRGELISFRVALDQAAQITAQFERIVIRDAFNHRRRNEGSNCVKQLSRLMFIRASTCSIFSMFVSFIAAPGRIYILQIFLITRYVCVTCIL